MTNLQTSRTLSAVVLGVAVAGLLTGCGSGDSPKEKASQQQKANSHVVGGPVTPASSTFLSRQWIQSEEGDLISCPHGVVVLSKATTTKVWMVNADGALSTIKDKSVCA